MSDKISVKDAQAEINGLLVAEICRDFGINFRDVYPEHILARGVGPEQAFIGLAIKRGHLALPAAQPDAAAIRGAALREAAEMLDEKHRGDLPKHILSESGNWVRALIDNHGKEVMPDDQTSNSTHTRPDIGPGDQAVAGAAQDAIQYGTGFMQDGQHVPLEDVCAQPKPVAGAAGPFRANPEDWPEDFRHENGNYMCLCATCGRQFFGYKRRGTCRVCAHPEPVADTWQPIATAPKDRVIDLWSLEGGRYPDAIWDVHCGVEGWTDANDHRSLEGYSFTHWMDRPAGPTEGGE